MKCGGKLKCLIFERGKRESGPTLNTQSDSILSRLYLIPVIFHLHASISKRTFCTFFVFMYIGNHFNFLAIDNDHMKPSKRQEYYFCIIDFCFKTRLFKFLLVTVLFL